MGGGGGEVRKNKFKLKAPAGKVTVSVLWDSEGKLLVEILGRGATGSSERYLRTLKMLKERIRRIRPKRKCRHNPKFSTHRLPPFSAPIGSTPKGRLSAEDDTAWLKSSDALSNSFTRPEYSV